MTAIDTQGMDDSSSDSNAGGYVGHFKISYTTEDNTNYNYYIENGGVAKVRLLNKL